ncbi:MAG TPA: sigma-70 family RNA polymerase sigma factor [Solirubrobacteraceae bacterium]|nr:sigma-70 family RNA polymerase sigma factor [Solirubrobacteraceae bacterium]
MPTTDDIRTLADEELMALVQAGDPRAFELLYDRHGGPAFSLAYRISGQRGVAEDVTQEAFLSIWRSRERYRPARGSVRSWIFGIVHNRAIDGLRRNLVHDRRRASAEGLEERPATDPPIEVEAIRREETRRVRTALRALPTDQTRVIELAYYGGYTHREIADLVDAPVGTVKGRMRLGLQRLRHELGEAVA